MIFYEIAFYLRIPVHQMLDEMPNLEFQGWLDYFKRRPYGWQDDQRTAMMLSPWADKKHYDPTKIFPSLKTIYEEQKGREEFEKRKLRKSPFIHMLKSVASKNGQAEWLDFIEENKDGRSDGDGN